MTKIQKEQAELVAKQSVELGTSVKNAVNTVLSSVDIGSIVAEYDPGWSEDEIVEMATSASDYLLEQFIGSLCYNAIDPGKYADRTLSTAFDQLRSAAEIAEQHPSPASDAQVDNRMKWVVQQLMQKEYRSALVNLAMGAHLHAIEKPYTVRRKAADTDRTSSTEAAKKLLKKAVGSK
jgi:hypothetical protein